MGSFSGALEVCVLDTSRDVGISLETSFHCDHFIYVHDI